MWTWRSWDWKGLRPSRNEECWGVEVIDLIPHSSRISFIHTKSSMYQLNLSKWGFVWLIFIPPSTRHHWLLQRFVSCFGRDLRKNTVFWRVQWFLGPWYVLFWVVQKNSTSCPRGSTGSSRFASERTSTSPLLLGGTFWWQPHVVLGVLLWWSGTFLGMKRWNLIFPWWFLHLFHLEKVPFFVKYIPFFQCRGIGIKHFLYVQIENSANLDYDIQTAFSELSMTAPLVVTMIPTSVQTLFVSCRTHDPLTGAEATTFL